MYMYIEILHVFLVSSLVDVCVKLIVYSKSYFPR